MNFFYLSIFLTIASTNFLMALEIRLKPPKRIYIDKKMLLADMETSKNLLEEATTQNFDDGIAITITYYVEFYEKRWFWDKKISECQIIKKIRKDIWSQNFFVNDGKEEKMFSNKERLNDNLQSVLKAPITQIDKINPTDRYYFKTRIAIKIKNYSSFYLLVNNIISLLKYRTTYVNSRKYLGMELLNQ